MSATSLLLIIVVYFSLMILLSRIRSGKGDNAAFFTGSKKSPWFLVAFGMIGASLSGVTFISVPGWVTTQGFGYMQIVLGYLVGYLAIAHVLLPLYYNRGNVSIYGFLKERFGSPGHKTGAAFFLLSKLVGAGFRLYLVASVLDLFVFQAFGIPFWLTAAIILGLILLYTYKGGIQTIVFTDTLQTAAMLASVIIALFIIQDAMGLSFSELLTTISDSGSRSKLFYWDPNSSLFFPKQFISGAFIALVMTGLDQDMMQKNLSIATLKQSQRNIHWQMLGYVIVNLVFLSLGVMLYAYAEFLGDGTLESSLMSLVEQSGLPKEAFFPKGEFRSDFLFPLIALKYGGALFGGLFFVGLIAAAYSSADSALTAMTTSYCVDFMKEEEVSSKKRKQIHFIATLVMLATIVLFNLDQSGTIIDKIFKAAGYTYGPLLGMFSFGILVKKRQVAEKLVPIIAILSPIITYIFNITYKQIPLLADFEFGYELLLINGALTLGLLYLFSKKTTNEL